MKALCVKALAGGSSLARALNRIFRAETYFITESTLAFLLSLAEMNPLESSLAVFRQAR